MSDFAAAPPCRSALLPGGAPRYPLKLSLKRQCNIFRVERKVKIRAAQMVNPSTYSSRISTDIALYEIAGVIIIIIILSLSVIFWV